MKKNKNLGQIFVNLSAIKKEIELIDIKDKIILEIGGGDGRATELLAKQAKKVICIEKDLKYCNILKEKFKKNNKVLVMCGDFLKFPPRKVDVIFGNIPYYISSEILSHIKKFEFEKAVLMFQKEFALKIVAKENTKEFGFLSLISQFYFNIDLKFIVHKTLFTPKPKVDSIVVLLSKTNKQIDKRTESIINCLFQHKKKTLKNALLDSTKLLKISKEDIFELLIENQNSNKRVFKLTSEEILDIAEQVCKWKKK
ncbi:MAG: 16S rRNA (adenine(1518)-N(6)/adenine(1519)-N(6))-dimethyltransferase RsmA [Candidatus Micrarchaeia archaeon]|jgi:16S rRNA (adenine1518-N6/adenine1519-N6)-dimethyltransferase